MLLQSSVCAVLRLAPRVPVMVVCAATLVAACAQDGSTPQPSLGSILPPVADAPPAEPAATRPASAAAGGATSEAPGLAEARSKRRGGDKTGALALLDKAAQQSPKDTAILKERGLLMLELGQIKKAEIALRAAIDAKSPDWRVHSGLGAALAAQGRQPDAQMQFAKALELAPDHPSVLNNLALSYALDGKPAEAERLLKRVPAAAAQAKRASQNLALLAGLGGRPQEAERLAATALPAEQARANAALLELTTHGEAAAPSEKPRLQRAAATQSDASETSFRLGGPRD